MATRTLRGILLDDQLNLSLAELSRACTRHAEWVEELVNEGILDPQGNEPRNWKFSSSSLIRARKAMRLERDLNVNMAGIAIVLDLMDQMDDMRRRLRRMEQDQF